MKDKPNYYKGAIETLQELKRDYPNHTLGQHIDTALDGYGNVWAISDKEFQFALNKYQQELEINTESSMDIDKIVKEGLNLDTILEEPEDEDY